LDELTKGWFGTGESQNVLFSDKNRVSVKEDLWSVIAIYIKHAYQYYINCQVIWTKNAHTIHYL